MGYSGVFLVSGGMALVALVLYLGIFFFVHKWQPRQAVTMP
jgi:hypothetical protein